MNLFHAFRNMIQNIGWAPALWFPYTKKQHAFVDRVRVEVEKLGYESPRDDKAIQALTIKLLYEPPK